ncbi:MAG: winged helix-turn-helix transcriptional regulator [Candidatus Woesearchaeota archaeon]|jgi:Lrp/AsnC family leucine-responsive transcriptional regulator
MNIDKIDKNLLRMLIENSRTPIARIAKQLRVSREVANYRLSRLRKNGVILSFVTEINTIKLGFIGAAVFVNVKATKQNDFKQFLSNQPFVSWVAELSGIWSFGFSIIGKTNEDLDSKFLQIYSQFKDDILDHRFTIHKKNTYFYEKYLEEKTIISKKLIKTNKIFKVNLGSLSNKEADAKDKVVLKELSGNSRVDSVSMAKKIKLTAPAVAKRIKNLEDEGYINKYSIFVDVSQLSLFQYSVFVVNKSLDNKKRLLSFLAEHSNVSFVAEYVGDEFVEFGLFVKNPYELRENLQQIEEQFPDNRVMEVSLFQKEIISIGPPKCVFE